jgi:hypothetical protein
VAAGGAPLPTPERLARAIEQAAREQRKLPPLLLVARARAGYYDDFKSDVVDPIGTLVSDLNRATRDGYYDFRDLMRRAIAGEFDATKEEGDAWVASADGQAAFREILEARDRLVGGGP